MFKQRRANAPFFKTPTPFDPLTGTYRALVRPAAIPRMMVARVVGISEDYLTCEGWHPESHTYLSDIIVAKPWLLRANPAGAIRYPDYTDTFENVYEGERDVTREEEGEDDREFTQTIEPPYFVGELLVAGRMEGIIGEQVLEPVIEGDNWSTPSESSLTGEMPMDGMKEDDKSVYWMDMNVAGRSWSDPNQLQMTFGKLDGPLAYEGTATLSVWADDPLADTGNNVTVHDRFLTVGDSLETGVWCAAVKYYGVRYVIAAQCPPS